MAARRSIARTAFVHCGLEGMRTYAPPRGRVTAALIRRLRGRTSCPAASREGLEYNVQMNVPNVLPTGDACPQPEDVSSRPLFFIDGNNLAYRAFFALPEEISTSTGFPSAGASSCMPPESVMTR